MVRKSTSHRRPWGKRDLQVLKKFAAQRKSQRAVAEVLGRTRAAVQQKAFSEGVSFRSPRGRRPARRKK